MDLKLAQSCKVLIVDDQVLAQGYMKYSLEELGFRDITYEDKANKAIKLIKSSHYDLIVCSYNLKKDQDGYHLYDELKSSHALSPRTAFVFISADTNAELVHSIVEMQPDDFLAKPFTVKDLDKRLSRVLTRKQALKKIYRLIESEKLPASTGGSGAIPDRPGSIPVFPPGPENQRRNAAGLSPGRRGQSFLPGYPERAEIYLGPGGYGQCPDQIGRR